MLSYIDNLNYINFPNISLDMAPKQNQQFISANSNNYGAWQHPSRDILLCASVISNLYKYVMRFCLYFVATCRQNPLPQVFL